MKTAAFVGTNVILLVNIKRTVRGSQVAGCTECILVYFSSLEEARDLLLQAHAKFEMYIFAEGSPAHSPAFADEDGCLLLLQNCTGYAELYT